MEETLHPSWISRLKEFIRECTRVLKVTKKPTGIEFKTIVKASGLGMIVIGLVGFIIQMASLLLF